MSITMSPDSQHLLINHSPNVMFLAYFDRARCVQCHVVVLGNTTMGTSDTADSEQIQRFETDLTFNSELFRW